jgi:hypothetical protein
MMRKIIAMKMDTKKTDNVLFLKGVFDQFLGGCHIYTVPCGNVFFDSFDKTEVCMFSGGRLSLCGLGEFKKSFQNVFEFKDFLEKYLENQILEKKL